MAGSRTRTPRPAGRSGTQSRDKGTRGGRPEPPAASKAPAGKTGSQARAGTGQPARAARATASAPAGPAVRPVPAWLQYTTWLLAAAGLGVSIYLTAAHYTSSAILACSDKGLVNCAAVTT